ncbi:hypothetical protein QZH41_004823 [Actinostola sp. cb2023]|nr:hypothetical protein QZH41_004823 [Actinostola sp. cb2023]
MIQQEITITIDSSTFWTDSTCVLRYIENKDKRFQTFVANRVAAILDQSTETQWKYVETSLNPADEASRGMTVDAFLHNKRWTDGPDFLKQSEETWPQRPPDMGQIPNDDPEVKKSIEAFAIEVSNDSDYISKVLEKFSSWTSLKKIIAWILRYKNNLRKQSQRRKANEVISYQSKVNAIIPLSVSEINDAERVIVKYVQKQAFKEELSILNCIDKENQESSNQSTVKKCSSIYKLDPIMKDSLLRVGGRLQRAPIENDAKHPIILPKKHHVVKLIINYYHRASAHSGIEYTLSLIRQKYWIIAARSSVRNAVNTCFDCRRRQAPVMQQKMASLPQNRTTPCKPPFTYVGVDCFGPFTVRRGRTTAKRYGVLFTCLTTRAIHIEVAYSMDTESFINSLRRFVARRGQPDEIRSDTGGNFVKGEKELRMAIQDWNQTQIHEYLLQHNVKWIFNPPAASHHGGVWERCIRTVRKVMKALLKQQVLDDEGLNTLMCEVESIVNGRPITKVSDDPKDLDALTPNHLLLLRAGTATPPGVFSKDDNYTRRRWRQVQYLSNLFWLRWTKEYLPSLQQRQKWNKPQRNLAADDIVLLLDENTPRSTWPLGRVLEVYSNSKDGSFIESCHFYTVYIHRFGAIDFFTVCYGINILIPWMNDLILWHTGWHWCSYDNRVAGNTTSPPTTKKKERIMKLCIELYSKNPHVLDPLRKLLYLPSNRTIRYHKNKTDQKPGWNRDMLHWCLREANAKKLKEQDFWGGFVLDEMKIQKNVEMVIKNGKHRLVGFVDLGEIHDDMETLSDVPKAMAILGNALEVTIRHVDDEDVPKTMAILGNALEVTIRHVEDEDVPKTMAILGNALEVTIRHVDDEDAPKTMAILGNEIIKMQYGVA